MRPLEALLIGALLISLFLRWLKPRNRQFTSSTLAMLGILLALHVGFDGVRWEMIPAYLMALVAAWILSSDLRRVSGARAGESSRWIAVPSMGKRAATGALLAVAAATAVAIPHWAFPRIVFPAAEGFYDIGRVDATWVDSTRAGRLVVLSAWYPAESPNGRPVSYHPRPGALASDLAAGTGLPGFTFRNLTAARTNATSGPRFSIREGRSPMVLVSHDVGSDRMDGTDLFERLAANGYVVVSIDHEGSAAGATRPDGTPIPASPQPLATEVDNRVADLRFVLDRVNQLPAHDAVDSVAGHVRLDRVAILGRGVGATAAAEMAVLDSRVTAGVAIAIDSIGANASRGVRRPFLVFTVTDPGSALDGIFRYGGTEIRLEGATAASLSDLALLGAPIVRKLGITSGDAPADIHAAVSALTLRFLDQYLKERREQTEVDLPPRVRVRVIPHQAR